MRLPVTRTFGRCEYSSGLRLLRKTAIPSGDAFGETQQLPRAWRQLRFPGRGHHFIQAIWLALPFRVCASFRSSVTSPLVTRPRGRTTGHWYRFRKSESIPAIWIGAWSESSSRFSKGFHRATPVRCFPRAWARARISHNRTHRLVSGWERESVRLVILHGRWQKTKNNGLPTGIGRRSGFGETHKGAECGQVADDKKRIPVLPARHRAALRGRRSRSSRGGWQTTKNDSSPALGGAPGRNFSAAVAQNGDWMAPHP